MVQAACLAEHVWVRHNDSQVNVNRGHDATLELEFSKFDSLQAAAAVLAALCRANYVSWFKARLDFMQPQNKVFHLLLRHLGLQVES